MNGYEITGIGSAAFEIVGPAHSKVKKEKNNQPTKKCEKQLHVSRSLCS